MIDIDDFVEQNKGLVGYILKKINFQPQYYGDLQQEGFIALINCYNRLGELSETKLSDSSYKSYVYKAIYSRIIWKYRKTIDHLTPYETKHKKPDITELFHDEMTTNYDNPETILLKKEKKEILYSIINNLTDIEFKILKYWTENKYKDNDFGISQTAFYKRLRKVKNKLRILAEAKLC